MRPERVPAPAEAGAVTSDSPGKANASEHTPRGTTPSLRGDDAMTKGERVELSRLARMRARVAKADIDAIRAERLAAFESELAREFPADDPRWTAIAEEADRLVTALDAQIANICRREGIAPEFRPGLSLGWYRRGQNGFAERRTELRKAGLARLEADARRAKAAVERWEASVCSDLAARALGSAEALAFLGALPAADTLLPALRLAELTEDGER